MLAEQRQHVVVGGRERLMILFLFLIWGIGALGKQAHGLEITDSRELNLVASFGYSMREY
jgi:hypothetical protein